MTASSISLRLGILIAGQAAWHEPQTTAGGQVDRHRDPSRGPRAADQLTSRWNRRTDGEGLSPHFCCESTVYREDGSLAQAVLL